MTLNSRQLYPIGYLPIATESELGVIKVGDGLNIEPDGLLTSEANLDRVTYSLTTADIAPGGNLQTSLEIASTFILLQIATNIPARIRFYNNTSYQGSDVNRDLMTKDINTGVVTANAPSGDHGVLGDFVTDGGFLTINTSPVITIPAIPSSAFIPITITNLSDLAQSVTLNLITIKLS